MLPADHTNQPTLESRSLALFGRELLDWARAHPNVVVTVALRCAPEDALGRAADPDKVGGPDRLGTLQNRLRQLDEERGRVTGGPAFGVVEIECPAQALPELARFEFFEAVVDWFWDAPDAPRHRPQIPERLYPFRPKPRRLETDIGDVVGGEAAARLARAVKKLAAPGNKDEAQRLAIDTWLDASVAVVRAALGDGDVPLLLDPPTADLARRLLDRALSDLGASGYMLCVRDPLSEDDYRIVATRNLKYPEMVSGFTGFNSAQWQSGPEDEVYCTNTTEAFRKLPKNKWFLTREGKRHWTKCARLFTPKADAAALEKDADGRRLYGRHGLYGPYFVREGLSGLACLHGRTADEKRCLSLYLNFTREVAFGTRVRAYLRALRDDLTRLYDEFRTEVCAPIDARHADRLLQVAGWLAELPVEPSRPAIRLAEPPSESPRHDSFEEALVAGLTRFLNAVLEVLGVDPARGLATLDRFSSETYALSPFARAGTAARPDLKTFARHHDPLQGEDAVAWVAIHRRPILVPRVKAPHLDGFHKPIDPDVKSRLVVPMFAGAELFAVLNVESYDEAAFTPGHLGLLSLIANPVVRAWRACYRRREAADLARMYDVLCAVLRVKANPDRWSEATSLWRGAVKDIFRAAHILMWNVDQPTAGDPRAYSSAFEPCAADKCPQPGGWTDYVAEHRQVVCLTDITPGNYTDYRKLAWAPDTEALPAHWKEIPAERVGHMKLSEDRTGSNTLCLIGVPLTDETQCFAVVWLLYEDGAAGGMFESRLIRDAYLVPFFPRSKSEDRTTAATTASGAGPSRKPFPVLNPEYTARLLDMFRAPVRPARESGRPAPATPNAPPAPVPSDCESGRPTFIDVLDTFRAPARPDAVGERPTFTEILYGGTL